MVLICGRHHPLLHEGGWRLVAQADGSFTAEPRAG
jgi:hypothetical protein